MTRNRFFEESNFHDWLIESNITSKASAISYCSYVSSVNNELHFNDELEEISNSQITKNYSQLSEEVLQVLSAKGFGNKINKTDKTISNWKSGFRAYSEYLVNNFQAEEEDDIKDEITNESLLINYNTSYTKHDLYKNFTLRLITQDRFYETIYFPISLVKKIFYKTDNKVYFDKWINNILDTTVIHLENSELELNKISNLYFDAEGVKAEVKKKYYQVYTKHANNTDKSPLATVQLKKIALDHNKPMLNIMNDSINELVELQRITATIKSKQKNSKINRPILAEISRELLSDSYLESINIEQLKAELELIGKHKDLQFMDSSFNLKKRAN